MACNCKNRIKFEEENGIKVSETYLQKSHRAVLKVCVMLIGFTLSIVTVPVVISVLIFNQVFRGGKGLTIPKTLSKYLV